jgi:proteasome accessory factor C
VFRVDRIRSVEPTEGRFTPPETPRVPEVRYVPDDDDVSCVIDLGPAATWVTEYYPVEIVPTPASASGMPGIRIRFSASDAAVAAGLLLRLGPDARLVEGVEVRSTLSALKASVLERYGMAG